MRCARWSPWRSPCCRSLAHRARQSCHLAMYQGGRVVVIAQVDSPERWSFGLKIGVMLGLTDTSSGHVLLAFRDEVERARMLAAHIKVDGELTMDPGELFEILRQVREHGHAVMPSRQIRSVTNAAFPILGVGAGDRRAQRALHRAHRRAGQSHAGRGEGHREQHRRAHLHVDGVPRRLKLACAGAHNGTPIAKGSGHYRGCRGGIIKVSPQLSQFGRQRLQRSSESIGRNHCGQCEADRLNGIIGREVVVPPKRADLFQYLGSRADAPDFLAGPPALDEKTSYRWRQLVRKAKGLIGREPPAEGVQHSCHHVPGHVRGRQARVIACGHHELLEVGRGSLVFRRPGHG